MFLNVLYQTMKVDKNKDRVFAFVKRILQLCLQEKPSLACGALFMISEVRPDGSGPHTNTTDADMDCRYLRCTEGSGQVSSNQRTTE